MEDHLDLTRSFADLLRDMTEGQDTDAMVEMFIRDLERALVDEDQDVQALFTTLRFMAEQAGHVLKLFELIAITDAGPLCLGLDDSIDRMNRLSRSDTLFRALERAKCRLLPIVQVDFFVGNN